MPIWQAALAACCPCVTRNVGSLPLWGQRVSPGGIVTGLLHATETGMCTPQVSAFTLQTSNTRMFMIPNPCQTVMF